MAGKKSGNSYSQLCRHTVIPFTDIKNYEEIINALSQNALRRAEMKSESYFWAKDSSKNSNSENVLCQEILTSPRTKNNKAIAMQAISDQASKAGSSIDMDRIIIRNILEEADLSSSGSIPIAVNISAQAALSKKFWDKIQNRLDPHNPQKILFEILEHDVPSNSSIDHLEALKEQGYRFVLDDYFSIGADQTPKQAYDMHQRRLDLFGPILSIIKFDGPGAITKAFENEDDMATLEQECDRLLELNTDFIFVAEHVPSFEEARRLPEQIDIFQGRDLQPEQYLAYIYTQEPTETTPLSSTMEPIT